MKIKELKNSIGEQVEVVCILKNIARNVGSNGKPYLSINVGDSTGEISGTMFSEYFNDGDENNFKSGMAIKVCGDVREWKGSANITIKGIEQIEMTNEQLLEFIPSITNEQKDRLIKELNDLVTNIKSENFNTLINGILVDYGDKFYNHPAAKGHHHNYLGGLLEHTVGVTKNALSLGAHYNLDMDLLLSGAVLHDIGKLFEYDYKNGEIERTESGVLLHHISLGVMFLANYIKSKNIKFDAITKNKLFHMILSHHGKHEYQTAVTPKFIEANILFQCDYIDFLCNHNKILITEKANGSPFIYDKTCQDFVYIK